MSLFLVGQRWLVDSEPELGLGTVTESSGRRVELFFPESNQQRTYAIEHAPLSRLTYHQGDSITDVDGETYRVANVEESDGLLIYLTDCGQHIPETRLQSSLQLNHPLTRLTTGQLDQPKWFAFKRAISKGMSRLAQSQLSGLLGVRADLIAHQLYVARQAAQQERVRVLLADEVGLGKTIEGGMIVTQLLKQGRAKRVLFAVPEALQIQWLMELVRRFSLMPEMHRGEDQDYHQAQLHIISHAKLVEDSELLLAAEFDCIVVDEAHRIKHATPSFDCLQQLSPKVPHLILLTATPEQLGVESHFHRLQLLDAAKFNSYEQFINEEQRYAEVNQVIQQLPENAAQIAHDYQLNYDQHSTTQTLIEQLLDRHGVGRMMFRNVRSAVSGFPTRHVHSYQLADDNWSTKFDWLGQWLTQNKQQKMLVIGREMQHILDCEKYLFERFGIASAVFHENQSLLERDKAAAYFADTETGSRVLLCSEIGSEGRNFQFCSHLLCLDLPDHPDLLEQRIGRLDRIGQPNDVALHFLFAPESVDEQQFIWFDQILNCIRQQNPAAGVVHDKHWQAFIDDSHNQELREQVALEVQQLERSIADGRDSLLELNSCRQPYADQLKSSIAEFEFNTPQQLIEQASELFQFHFEDLGSHIYSIVPSDKMLIGSLPGVPPEGADVTFERSIAVQREELLFISWDSPIVEGLNELMQYSEIGSASVAILPHQQIPPGICLLESCFEILITSEYAEEIKRYLPTLTLRCITADLIEKDLSEMLTESKLNQSIEPVKAHVAKEIIRAKKSAIDPMYRRCEDYVQRQLEQSLEAARDKANQHYQAEIERLERLTKAPTIEKQTTIVKQIEELKQKRHQIIYALNDKQQLILSGIRLIVTVEAKK